MLKQAFIFITSLAMFIITVDVFELLVPMVLGIDAASPEVMRDPSLIKSFIERQPVSYSIGILLSHAVGALIGGSVLGFGGLPKWSAFVIAGLLCLIGNELLLPGHPAWFWILDLIVTVPSVLLGYEWVSQSRKMVAAKMADPKKR